MLRFNRLAAPVQSNDFGWAVEGAHHQDDAPIIVQVRDRLCAAADVIEVEQGASVDDAQAVETFGRQVDVPAGRRRGRDEKHVLRFYKGPEAVIDRVIYLAHSERNVSTAISCQLLALSPRPCYS